MSSNNGGTTEDSPQTGGRWRPRLFGVLACLLVVLGAWLLAAWQSGGKGPVLAVGREAPDFVLRTTDGEQIRFSDRLGQRPVVLLFGSWTCPYCVGQFDRMVSLEKKYRGKVDFLFVYCKEAHPGQPMSSLTGGTLPVLEQTTTWDDRAARAQRFGLEQGVAWPILVDEDGEGSVQRLYGDNPNQLIVVGADGRVVLIGGSGTPSHLDDFLAQLLSNGAA